MIVLKTSNFILFIFLIIIGTIGIYMQLFPCECNCDVKHWRTKYIPIYIKSKKISNKISKEDNKEKNLTKHSDNKIPKEDNKISKEDNKKQSSASIGNHSSTHGGSIVPSIWIDDDESDYEFKY